MTTTLPQEVQDVFARFITTEYTTVDSAGQPVTWPVTPYYRPGGTCIDITTGLGYPKKADDAQRNPRVGLLFSDPTGSRLERPPAVLVQGMADVDDRDLEENRERYVRESVEKLPATESMHPPKPLRRLLNWYYMRIYVHIRPERVFVWPDGDFSRAPQLYGSHLDEVRSGHSQEPEVPHAPSAGGGTPWDDRLRQLASRHETSVISIVAPDGFPMSARVQIEPDEAGGRIHLGELPVGVPLAPGRACLTAHEHEEEFRWQVNFQVRGNLVPEGDGWSLVPRKLVGGFELPPGSMLDRYRVNARKMVRFRRIANRRLRSARR